MATPFIYKHLRSKVPEARDDKKSLPQIRHHLDVLPPRVGTSSPSVFQKFLKAPSDSPKPPRVVESAWLGVNMDLPSWVVRAQVSAGLLVGLISFPMMMLLGMELGRFC